MLKVKSLLVTAMLLMAVFTAVAVAAPAAKDDVKASQTTIKTYLRSDLSFKSVLSPELFQPAGVKPAATAFVGRTCRCSCGQPCKTDADCGGGVCAPGITCCNRSSSKDTLSVIFQQKDALSSSKHPSPVAVAVNCQ